MGPGNEYWVTINVPLDLEGESSKNITFAKGGGGGTLVT